MSSRWKGMEQTASNVSRGRLVAGVAAVAAFSGGFVATRAALPGSTVADAPVLAFCSEWESDVVGNNPCLLDYYRARCADPFLTKSLAEAGECSIAVEALAQVAVLDASRDDFGWDE